MKKSSLFSQIPEQELQGDRATPTVAPPNGRPPEQQTKLTL